MYDTGIRGASDVFKALAIGAKFVFIGRLWVWALSIAGEHGVRHVMKGLLAEFDILLAAHHDYTPGYFMAGQTLVKAGRIDEAKARLREGIASAQRTGNAHALSEMEQLLDELGD